VSPLSGEYDAALRVLRSALFYVALVLAVIVALDWAVRTRRISPFSPIARFMRTVVDPLMAPMERVIVRAGGLPSSAPWWSLAAAVVGGLVLLAAIDFVFGMVQSLGAAMRGGVGGMGALLIHWTFGLLQLALLIRILSSWFRISSYSRWIRWTFALTEPILRPLRQIIPTIGYFDITPIVAFFLLRILEGLLLTVL
jgi:YggT family protein